MPNLLVALFAVVDTNTWSFQQIRSWADESLLCSQCPRLWLTDLSMSTSMEDALSAVRDGLRECMVVLPEDVGDLMAGLVFIRLHKGVIDSHEARRQLIDLVDAYSATHFDMESLMELGFENSGAMLSTGVDQELERLSKTAEEVLKYLRDPKIYEKAWRLIEELLQGDSKTVPRRQNTRQAVWQ